MHDLHYADFTAEMTNEVTSVTGKPTFWQRLVASYRVTKADAAAVRAIMRDRPELAAAFIASAPLSERLFILVYSHR